jgi:hypothetical protein
MNNRSFPNLGCRAPPLGLVGTGADDTLSVELGNLTEAVATIVVFICELLVTISL